MFRFALARTGDADLAHEAVQEGFARAIAARRSFRNRGTLEGWIARCVINAAHDSVGPYDQPLSLGRPGESSSAETSHDRVRDAVRELPERQREVLFLRYYLDLDYAAIAEALEIEVGMVSATLHAAKNRLAQLLKEVRT